MILYGSSLSPFVRKVLAFAGEKGIELELRASGFPDPTPEFCSASPFRKMPALADGDYMLADSSAIIHYLEAKQPDPPLIPADPQQRGRTIWFDEFGDTILTVCAAKMFVNRVVLPRFVGRPGDDAAADAAQHNELPPILDYLEKVVPDGEGFLVGETITLADLAVATPFVNLGHLGVAVGDRSRLQAYVDRIHARPSFAQWIEREKAMFAREPA